MNRALGWPIIIIALAIGTGLATVLDIGPPIQPLMAFGFFLICPGMAFVRLLHFEQRLTEFTVAIALSLAMGTIVAETMVLTKQWSPLGGLFILVGLSLGGAILQILQAKRQRFGT